MSGKAVFFDRDNTLIEDPGYINHPHQVKLLPGAAGALVKLKQLGYKLIVVSNQSAVARGIVTENVLAEIHDRLKQLFAAEGAYLDQIYYCPYHPDGSVEKYRKQSDLRKPNPGMLLLAAEEMDLDLSASWMVGDSFDDVIAGRQAGCKTILIKPLIGPTFPEAGRPRPDYQAVNIKEAANIIKRYAQSAGSSAAKPLAQPIPPADPQNTDKELEALVRQPDEPPQALQTTETTEDEKPPPGHSSRPQTRSWVRTDRNHSGSRSA